MSLFETIKLLMCLKYLYYFHSFFNIFLRHVDFALILLVDILTKSSCEVIAIEIFIAPELIHGIWCLFIASDQLMLWFLSVFYMI